MLSNSYHTPVLLNKCVQFLNPQAGGVYADCTLGGGGHSLALLQTCPDIKIYGFDQDSEAIKQASINLTEFADRIELINTNFSSMRTELALREVKSIDGAIYDLGVSSHQLDNGERGFSFDKDAPLDMRMNRSGGQTAADVVNLLTEFELKKVIKEYGEDNNAGKIARAIVRRRVGSPIHTTGELVSVIESVAGKGSKESLKTKVRVFQGFRIYVNKELDVLEPGLKDAINILKPGGRIVVLSYHSLEDRIVKNVFRDASQGCVCQPIAAGCSCGKAKQVTILTKRPIIADEQELAENIRSRSVRFRAAEKILEEK